MEGSEITNYYKMLFNPAQFRLPVQEYVYDVEEEEELDTLFDVGDEDGHSSGYYYFTEDEVENTDDAPILMSLI